MPPLVTDRVSTLLHLPQWEFRPLNEHRSFVNSTNITLKLVRGSNIYQSQDWNQHSSWSGSCPALFLPFLSEGGDMGLRYVTKDLPDKNNARELDLWRYAFELCKSASAYRYNTMHTKHINKNKLLLKFTQEAAGEWRGKGIVNEHMKCWRKVGQKDHTWDGSNGKRMRRGKMQHWWK